MISTGGGRPPVWSRNRRELFYQAQDYRIMVTTYSAKGDSFAADKPRPWWWIRDRKQRLDRKARFTSRFC